MKSSTRHRRRNLAAASILALALVTVRSADAAGPEGWAIYYGGYDTASDDESQELGFELRHAEIDVPKLPPTMALRPAYGVAGTKDGNAWIYGGLRLEMKVGDWLVTPQFAVSLYDEGGGKDLGGVLEFRSGLEATRQLGDGPRFGLLFYHLSNGGFYTFNPGSNSLVMKLSLGR